MGNRTPHEICNIVLKWAMRVGYGARGFVYLLVGGLAMFAAINGGEAEGTSGALAYLAQQPFGNVLLAFIAGGLFTYSLWRFIDALLDLEEEGHDAEGIGNRIGQFMSGATHAVLGLTALGIIIPGRSGSSGSGTESMTELMLNQPAGRYIVIGAGLTTGAVGIYLLIKSAHSKWKKSIESTELTEKLMPLVRFGLASHGLVLLIIACLFIWAGVTLDADKAGGLEEALTMLEQQAFGRILLFVTGAGLAGFSVYCFVYSGYRVVPKLAHDTYQTLASPFKG